MSTLLFGSVIGWRDSIPATIAQFPSMPVAQCSLGTDHTWSFPPPFTVNEIPSPIDYPLFFHAPHTINIGRPNDNRALGLLNRLLRIQGEFLPRGGVVVHCGKVGGVARSVEVLQSSTLAKVGTLLIENAAGQGTEIGATVDEWVELLQKCTHPNTRACLDTQHSFAAGWCRWSSPQEVDTFLTMLESKIPSSTPLQMIHLNDSDGKPFGSRVDRHAPLGKGCIWKDEKGGLRRLLEWASQRGWYVVSETGDPFSDWEVIQKLW
jgi:deoxyribonuclease-4